MSADGRMVAWLASGDGASRLVLFDVATGTTERAVPAPASRCRAFTWSHLPGVGLAVADTGDERTRLYRLDAPDADWTPLSGPAGSQLRIAGLSPHRPDQVLLAVNARDPRVHDYEIVSLRTAGRTTVLENRGYAAAYADESLRPRLVETVAGDGSRDFWHGPPERGRLFLHVPPEDALCVRVAALTGGGGAAVYLVMPAGTDGMRLARTPRVEGRPAAPRTVYAVRSADLPQVHFSVAGRPDVVVVESARRRSVALDQALDPALRALRRRLGAEPILVERRVGGRYWIVATHHPRAPAEYHLYEPGCDTLRRLPTDSRPHRRPALTCRVARVPLRGGTRAVTYLTRGPAAVTTPPGGPSGPAVLLVHGGPWRRARWEYLSRRAWLAALGLTVVEPNFRGSTGFGRAWVNAGDRQWGAAMQDDLEDTLDWATSRGYADPDRIALVGGSYGGYAVLQMAATSSRRVRCVVATSAITDLPDFLTALPPYWRTARPMVLRRIGDPAVPAERERLMAASPLRHAANLRCPVLLVHGRHDSRVPVRMATRMFMALARHGRDATLALLTEEGHEIVDAVTRQAVDELTADFLGRHLVGRYLVGRAGAGRDERPEIRVLETRPC
ncbi:MAG TPA: alpha/beta fold hydrolase [Mycobacteriales bacterium]|nr:alpha/beta fold hydrolase [Mycobacteriales bacterium]